MAGPNFELLRFEINLVQDSVVSTLCNGLDSHSRLTGLWEIQIRNANSVSQLHALGQENIYCLHIL